MVRLLLIVFTLLGFSHQAPFVLTNCGCGGGVETFPLSTAPYCPIGTYSKCNGTMLVESSCTLTCPYSRSVIAYRNVSASWIATDSITCSNGVYKNALGATITTLIRPTCGFFAPCNNCANIAFESSKCPEGSSCNPANYKRAIDPSDECDRVSCENSAALTLYDDAKNVIPFPTQQLYCTVANKWQNYSYQGNLAGGTAVPTTTTFTANCILPKSCETCRNPDFILAPTQMPEAFRTGYITENPTIKKEAGQCATVTCRNGFQLMGFVGIGATQNGLNYTNQNVMKCAANGQWKNGEYGYTPQDIKVICAQKITPCPPIDTVISTDLNVACDEQKKVSTITCPVGKKLYMRYSLQSSSIKYDRATFFAGKGWLAHGCDATAALFTTAAGASINGACA